jgi:hypothetical protein
MSTKTTKGRGAEGAQVPATSKGPTYRNGEDVVLRGQGWVVRKREYQGRTYYDLQVRGTWDRSPAQILREAIPEIQKAIEEKRLGGPVGYTQWVGRKPLRYLIFADGLRVQVGNGVWAGTGLVRRIYEFMAPFNRGGNGVDEDAGYDNLPGDEDEGGGEDQKQ